MNLVSGKNQLKPYQSRVSDQWVHARLGNDIIYSLCADMLTSDNYTSAIVTERD